MGMPIVEWNEYLTKQESIVVAALAGHGPQAQGAFDFLMKEAQKQISELQAALTEAKEALDSERKHRRALARESLEQRALRYGAEDALDSREGDIP